MAKKEILEYEAMYLIYGNKTMDEAASALKISTRTLQLHMNKELQQINPELYQEVRKKLDKIAKERQILGGKKGKRTTGYDINFINEIADELINNFKDKSSFLKQVGTTNLRYLSDKYKIPTSTLYELFMEYLDKDKLDMIKSIFEYNRTIAKRNKNTIDQFDKNDFDIMQEDDTGVKKVEGKKRK